MDKHATSTASAQVSEGHGGTEAFPPRHASGAALLVSELYSTITYDVIATVTSVANHRSRASS
jgi:hypothetical protein